MPSRFTGLEPQTLARPVPIERDPYDDYPLDPDYVAPVGLQACTPPTEGAA